MFKKKAFAHQSLTEKGTTLCVGNNTVPDQKCHHSQRKEQIAKADCPSVPY